MRVREYKSREVLSRSEIAARLKSMAEGIEKGYASVGDMRVSIPDQAELEVEVERNELEIKIEWR